MQVSKLSKGQYIKVLKTALYIGASALLSYLITYTTNNPDLFGPLTGLINVGLVTLRQLFKTEE